MADEFDMPVFAFHDLDYIPWGLGGIVAPYIETPAATSKFWSWGLCSGLSVDKQAE